MQGWCALLRPLGLSAPLQVMLSSAEVPVRTADSHLLRDPVLLNGAQSGDLGPILVWQEPSLPVAWGSG